MRKIYAIIVVTALSFSLLTGCNNSKDNQIQSLKPNQAEQKLPEMPDEDNSDATVEHIDVEFAQSDDDMFSNRDGESTYEESDAITITLNGDSATASSDTVNISGSTVTITTEATYIVSGSLNNGSLVVDTDDTAKLQIVFDNVSINNDSSAAFYIIEADKVFVTLTEGSANTLSNGGEFIAIDDNNIDGTVFSKQDLTFNGSGSLDISSPAGHGIVCKDDLVFTEGTYIITSSSHGLDVNDSIRVSNADITIASGKDGMHAENSEDATLGFVYISSGTFDIDAEGDGISGSAYVQIEGGDFDILTGGGSENGSNQTSDNWGDFGGGFGGPGGGHGGNKNPGGWQPDEQSSTTTELEDSTSIKGIKSTNSILISNGTFVINSADDSIHSNVSIIINGGDISIKSGDDGLHADEDLTITDGIIDITESYEGLEGLDINISGGDITIVANDDGINAAGGVDSSGMGGNRGGDRFQGGGMSAGNGSIIISGGTIYMNASGDGIDANGSLEITGGYTVVCGPTNGDTSVLDYDGSAIITGGTFIGTGASMMAQSFTSSTQGVIGLSVGNIAAQTNITIKDTDENTIIDYSPKLNYQIVVISTPDLISGDDYEVSIGDYTDTFQAY